MVRWCGLTLQRFLRRSLRCLRRGAANPLVIVRATAYGGVVDLRDKTKLEGVEHVYREGSRYSKAEVLLLDLSIEGRSRVICSRPHSRWRVKNSWVRRCSEHPRWLYRLSMRMRKVVNVLQGAGGESDFRVSMVMAGNGDFSQSMVRKLTVNHCRA